VSGGSVHRLILASAGSGKTFQLTHRYIGLLAGGVPPDRILATTFTRKAAGEILQRIVLRLAEASRGGRALEEVNRFAEASLTAARAGDLLVGLLGSLHRARLPTIDALLAQMAAVSALSIPPERPSTTPGNRFFLT